MKTRFQKDRGIIHAVYDGRNIVACITPREVCNDVIIFELKRMIGMRIADNGDIVAVIDKEGAFYTFHSLQQILFWVMGHCFKKDFFH
jgi:hypothetical protein